jgi:large subunit ribosomal protein L1
MGKRITAANKLVDKTKSYELKKAVSILKQAPPVKFDESVDISIKLGIDLKEITQPVRGSVVLPHGTGKKIRVAVFCKGEQSQTARQSGAEIVGGDDLIDKVNSGFLDFDIAIATPDMMKDMAKLGKVLGPRGLMPSPKAGTVTMDVAKAIKDVKGGKIEFKMDKLGCINISVGKRSFAEDAIVENAKTLIEAVAQAKPSQIKGRFLKSVHISTTMGPGVRLNTDIAD